VLDVGWDLKGYLALSVKHSNIRDLNVVFKVYIYLITSSTITTHVPNIWLTKTCSQGNDTVLFATASSLSSKSLYLEIGPPTVHNRWMLGMEEYLCHATRDHSPTNNAAQLEGGGGEPY
jgi:hypothetical protein